MTLLDFAGPQACLGPHSNTHLVSNTMEPVLSDSGVSVLPTVTYATCPQNLDILLVGGGSKSNDVMKDAEALAFLAESAKTARYVTSVCSGSLILGAAGLLDGYKAATHWACFPALEELGVEAVHERVVADRNRYTGGGVTAGIDFGLTLLAQLRGEMTAKVTQLVIEYDPKPPFDAGTPELAGPELTSATLSMIGGMHEEAVEIARSIRKHRAQLA